MDGWVALHISGVLWVLIEEGDWIADVEIGLPWMDSSYWRNLWTPKFFRIKRIGQFCCYREMFLNYPSRAIIYSARHLFQTRKPRRNSGHAIGWTRTSIISDAIYSYRRSPSQLISRASQFIRNRIWMCSNSSTCTLCTMEYTPTQPDRMQIIGTSLKFH